MNPQRISVKLYVAEPQSVDPAGIIPVFHRWIQRSAVPGMLIDVADYRHMINGPGVVLVGHEVDYAWDVSEGRAGMMHTRKRSPAGTLSDRVAGALHAGLLACRILEQEESLDGTIRFRTDEARLIFGDRLNTPNRASTFEQVRDEIAGLLESVHEGSAVRIERETDDDRRPLSLRVTVSDAADLKTLIERLATRVSE